MNTLILKTVQFCNVAHAGQKRKYTGEDYSVHPLAVARTLAGVGARSELIVAGLLHDVLEDTSVTYKQLVTEFGEEIADLVVEVTDGDVEGNRDYRMRTHAARLGTASNDAKTIKLADILDNTKDIAEQNRSFSKIYLAEKRYCLPYLKGGSSILWNRLDKFLTE